MIPRARRVLAYGLLMLLPGTVSAQRGARVPVQAWLETVMGIRSLAGSEPAGWRPDGQAILFASSLGGGGLWSVSSDGGFPQRLVESIGGPGHFLSSQRPRWSPKGDAIAWVSDRSGGMELWMWRASDGAEIQLTRLGGRINSFSWSPDGGRIAFAGDIRGNFDIWEVTRDGTTRQVTSNPALDVFPTWTPDGQSLAFVRLDESWERHDVITLPLSGLGLAGPERLVVRDSGWFDYGAGESFGYPSVSPDGRRVLFRSRRSGWINYWTADIGGASAATAVAPAEADQSEAEWAPDGRSIAYVENHNGTLSLRTVASTGGAARVVYDPVMGMVANPAWSPDGRRILYSLATPTRPADLFVIDAAGGKPRQLTVSADTTITDPQLVKPTKVSYTSFDGTKINALLYAPKAIQPNERFPGVVLVHGGPTSQFLDRYELQAQFFAQQGYVLLLPNIRGSSGYGTAFERANNGDWGHGDLKDVVAGVDFLKTLSYVNPSSMGITGTSYGGFMVPAAAVWAPTVFQAGIAASGYPNRLSFVDEGEIRHIKQLNYEFGPFAQNRDVYRRNSPFFDIRNIQMPLFLLNGEGKFPGSPQMKQFAEEMERQYKPFRYEAYPGENYYVRSPSNTRKMLLDMLSFFDMYLK